MKSTGICQKTDTGATLYPISESTPLLLWRQYSQMSFNGKFRVLYYGKGLKVDREQGISGKILVFLAHGDTASKLLRVMMGVIQCVAMYSS